MTTEITTIRDDLSSKDKGKESCGCTLAMFTGMLNEIENQPMWRARADKEMDYRDGNQLDSDILNKQRALGIPPAVENMIGPTIDEVLGAEAKKRTDWRVLPDGDKTGEDVAEATNFELNQAERRSGADRACSAAYDSQVSVGIGFVEVARESDPFKYKYRCTDVHRNEIWWDFLAKKQDLTDARYMIRKRWTDLDIAKKMFPTKEDLLHQAGTGWNGIDIGELTTDGSRETGLALNWNDERGWTVEEQQWRDAEGNRVCLFEVWYREYVRALVLKTPDGRAIEFDEDNWAHVDSLRFPGFQLFSTIISKVRLAYFAGPHRLHDGPSPYRHGFFPYVPFWGKREDRTGVPFGLVRGMMYLQDEINARISKMQWGLSAVRVTRTRGAVESTDQQFREEIARPDADIILDQKEMAKKGAEFKVERDFSLNTQQAERLRDAREALRRMGRVTDTFAGVDTQGKSGSAISQLLEQSVQALADIDDNFHASRTMVGELLLSMIIEDMKGERTEVLVDGGIVKEDKVVVLNDPMVHEESGKQYLNNDTERTKLKVTLSDVPSTPSFRAQQLMTMTESFKSASEQVQNVMMPHMMTLWDVPADMKKQIVEAVRRLGEQPTPEQIQEQIDMAVAEEMTKKLVEQTDRKIDLQEREMDSKISKAAAETTAKNIDAIYSAVQAALQAMGYPGAAAGADQILNSAGFVDQDQAPIVEAIKGQVTGVAPDKNTSPAFPGRADDGLPPEMEEPFPGEPGSPEVGMQEGSEAGGPQL